MAYTTLPTVATGDTLTAAQWNLWVKDNFAALWPYTASGEIAFASGPTTLTKLSPVAGKYIRFNAGGTAPEAVDLPVTPEPVHLYRRQGGSPTNYNTPGTTNYTPTSTTKRQGGVVRITMSAETLKSVTVTFPVAFSDVPKILVSSPFYSIQASYRNPTASTVIIDAYAFLGSATGSFDISWEAEGIIP